MGAVAGYRPLTRRARGRRSMDQELIAYLDERFNEVIDRMDARFGEVDARLEGVDARFGQVEGAIRGLGVEIEGLRGQIQQVAEGVAVGNEKLASFQTEVYE